MHNISSVLKATELHALKWFLLSAVNFTSVFTNNRACLKVVSAAEGVLGAGWHFRKGVQEGLPGEGREDTSPHPSDTHAQRGVCAQPRRGMTNVAIRALDVGSRSPSLFSCPLVARDDRSCFLCFPSLCPRPGGREPSQAPHRTGICNEVTSLQKKRPLSLWLVGLDAGMCVMQLRSPEIKQ